MSWVGRAVEVLDPSRGRILLAVFDDENMEWPEKWPEVVGDHQVREGWDNTVEFDSKGFPKVLRHGDGSISFLTTHNLPLNTTFVQVDIPLTKVDGDKWVETTDKDRQAALSKAVNDAVAQIENKPPVELHKDVKL